MSLVCNEGLASLAIVSLETMLPKKVTITGLGYFVFTYGASGRKMKQEFYNPSGVRQRYMDYNGEFVYKNNTLQLIHHEQGRYLPGGEYQYVLTDHLGNTRVTFTTKPRADTYTAGYEDNAVAYESVSFSPSYGTAVRLTAFNRTPGGAKSQRLSAANQNEIIGLSKGLKVLPGDVVDLEVYARYVQTGAARMQQR